MKELEDIVAQERKLATSSQIATDTPPYSRSGMYNTNTRHSYV